LGAGEDASARARPTPRARSCRQARRRRPEGRRHPRAGDGFCTPFLLVDGVCAGIWGRKKRARRIELTVEPARKLNRDEQAGVEAEAERIGVFLGPEPTLSIA